MEKEIEITKEQRFMQVRELLVQSAAPQELLNFIDNEVEILHKKAESSKKARTKKKAENDVLKEQVFSQLATDKFITIPELMKVYSENEEITPQKITSRLTALIKEGLVEKDIVAVEVGGKQKKATGYRIVQ